MNLIPLTVAVALYSGVKVSAASWAYFGQPEELKKISLERWTKAGIQSRPLFLPNHLLALGDTQAMQRQGEFPVAEKLWKTGISLPSSPGLDTHEIDEICEVLEKAIGFAMSCPFGIGGGKFHYAEKEMFVDTVYLGAYRREVLEKI